MLAGGDGVGNGSTGTSASAVVTGLRDGRRVGIPVFVLTLSSQSYKCCRSLVVGSLLCRRSSGSVGGVFPRINTGFTLTSWNTRLIGIRSRTSRTLIAPFTLSAVVGVLSLTYPSLASVIGRTGHASSGVAALAADVFRICIPVSAVVISFVQYGGSRTSVFTPAAV